MNEAVNLTKSEAINYLIWVERNRIIIQLLRFLLCDRNVNNKFLRIG